MPRLARMKTGRASRMTKGIPCLIAAVLAVTLGVGIAQAKTTPTRRLQVFLLGGSPDSLADLKAHIGAIGVVYPTYYECALGSGQIEGAGEAAITDYADSRHLQVMPRFNCQDGATVHAILTEPALRERTLNGLVSLAASPGYAGLSLDLENDGYQDRAAMSSFVSVLAGRLHAIGRKLTVVVVGVLSEAPRASTSFYDENAIAAAADHVFVLAWGTHWLGSEPGPIAPLPWVRAVAARIATLSHAGRFVLGVPMYGLDWPAGGGPNEPASAYQYTGVVSLLHQAGVQPVHDRYDDEMTFAYSKEGVSHRVWYLNARSILDRLALARSYGLTAGVWRLGAEEQSLWSSPSV